MKKYLVGMVALCGLLMFSFPARALTIDTIVASTNIGSGDGTELAWVQSVLGTDYTMEFKQEFKEGEPTPWVSEGSSTYSLNLGTREADYFLVKVGNGGFDNEGKKTASHHFLFKNIGELQYAVINLAAMGFTKIEEIAAVSHIAGFNGTTQVPEPGTLLLLGSGLLGIGILRRRHS